MKSVWHFKLIVRTLLPLILLTSAQAQTSELSREERWRDDVRFYARELPKRHKNLFFQLPKDEFEREVKRLELQVPKLSDGEIAVELMRISARIGDGHTVSFMPASGMTFFPLRLERFSEGWFVTQTTDEYKNALGARLVKVGNMKIERVAQSLKKLISADNELDRESRLRFFFVWSGVLQAKGILKNEELGKFTFRDRDDKLFSLNARPIPAEEFIKIQLRGLSDEGKTPLSAKNTQANY